MIDPNPYAPSPKDRQTIAEQALRELYAALQVLEYQLRVERKIAPLLGDSGAANIAQIEQQIRQIAGRIEAYQEIRAELELAQEQSAAALQNGKAS